MEENKISEVPIDVIVADASHEKYVDEILETISAAANKMNRFRIVLYRFNYKLLANNHKFTKINWILVRFIAHRIKIITILLF